MSEWWEKQKSAPNFIYIFLMHRNNSNNNNTQITGIPEITWDGTEKKNPSTYFSGGKCAALSSNREKTGFDLISFEDYLYCLKVITYAPLILITSQTVRCLLIRSLTFFLPFIWIWLFFDWICTDLVFLNAIIIEGEWNSVITTMDANSNSKKRTHHQQQLQQWIQLERTKKKNHKICECKDNMLLIWTECDGQAPYVTRTSNTQPHLSMHHSIVLCCCQRWFNHWNHHANGF